MEVQASRRSGRWVAGRDRRGQHRDPFRRLPPPGDAAGRRDIDHLATDDLVRTRRPPQHEPVAGRRGHRLGEPQDRDRAVDEIDRVATTPPDRGVDGGRAQVQPRPCPLRDRHDESDQQAIRGHDRRVAGEHLATG